MPISLNASEEVSGNGKDVRVLDVDLGARSYNILIGASLLDDLAAHLSFDPKGRTLFVLTDENVANFAGEKIYQSLLSVGAESVNLLALPAGEATKSVASFERTMAWMLDNGVNRDSVLFAVGGGVIGDLGGFAAASVMRGIEFIQVPTSLLAQVDSSVGGKTGINMPQGKNLVGAFHQPQRVFCDLSALKTLPQREMRAGYAEIVKYGLINDAAFFEWLEQNGNDICATDLDKCAEAVAQSCNKKADVVAADEREQGQRALLNLGHTFGHTIEAAAQYDGRVLHGEAVAIGMVLAFRLSCKMGLCTQDDVDRVQAHLSNVGLPTDIHMIAPPIKASADDLLALMKKDKKIRDGKNTFILARGIGQSFVTDDVKTEDVRAIIQDSMTV
jgi:3-dehydroquinate synthase